MRKETVFAVVNIIDEKERHLKDTKISTSV